MSNQRYSPEFRDEAVRQIIDCCYSVGEVSKRLGVSSNSLYKWVRAVNPDTSSLKDEELIETKRENLKLRDELLNGEIFYTLTEAQVIIEHWRNHYNTKRLHSALGYRPPAQKSSYRHSNYPITTKLRKLAFKLDQLTRAGFPGLSPITLGRRGTA